MTELKMNKSDEDYLFGDKSTLSLDLPFKVVSSSSVTIPLFLLRTINGKKVNRVNRRFEDENKIDYIKSAVLTASVLSDGSQWGNFSLLSERGVLVISSPFTNCIPETFHLVNSIQESRIITKDTKDSEYFIINNIPRYLHYWFYNYGIRDIFKYIHNDQYFDSDEVKVDKLINTFCRNKGRY